MNENNTRLIQHLTTNNPPPPLVSLILKFNDLADLNVRVTMNLKVTEVQEGHIRIEIGDVNHQVLVLGEKGSLFRQNPDHPTRLLK